LASEAARVGSAATLLILTSGYRADRSIDFIVVGFHNCMYCTNAVHGSDGGNRARWQEKFERLGVTETGARVPEVATWSAVRYPGHSIAIVDVTHRDRDGNAAMTIRAIAKTGEEVDRVTLYRRR